jgi:hypothetical protein
VNVGLTLPVAKAFEVFAKQLQALGRLADHRGVQKGTPVKAVHFKTVIIQTSGDDFGLFSRAIDHGQQGCK